MRPAFCDTIATRSPNPTELVQAGGLGPGPLSTWR
jgi:hypothetical protein